MLASDAICQAQIVRSSTPDHSLGQHAMHLAARIKSTTKLSYMARRLLSLAPQKCTEYVSQPPPIFERATRSISAFSILLDSKREWECAPKFYMLTVTYNK